DRSGSCNRRRFRRRRPAPARRRLCRDRAERRRGVRPQLRPGRAERVRAARGRARSGTHNPGAGPMTATQPSLFPTDSEYETVTRQLSPDALWERVFTVAPLVIVGSKEADGTYDLAPKHMAMPLGWRRRYGFVCTPRHRTYRNIERHGVF